MLGIGKIEILEASYCLGMCGHITFRDNLTGRQCNISMSMQDGWIVKLSDDGGTTWTKPNRMTTDDAIGLLPVNSGWNYSTFISVWAGFAAGFEAGVNKERYRNRK